MSYTSILGASITTAAFIEEAFVVISGTSMQISVVDDTSEQNDDGCVESLTSVSGIYKAADGISDAVLIVMLQPVKANITNNNRQNTFKRNINTTSYIEDLSLLHL